MKRRVAFKTLGCRLNQFETDSVLTDFYKTGYDIVPFNEPADVYVVNTCTVTNQGIINHAVPSARPFMERKVPLWWLPAAWLKARRNTWKTAEMCLTW